MRMLNKGDETDTEVSWSDQQKINKFSKLNSSIQDLEDTYNAKLQQKEFLDDLAQELELCDEEELIKYRIGDVFMSLPYAEVQELIGKEQKEIEVEVAERKKEMSSISTEMEHLKTELYSRFGTAINLESS